MKSLNKNNKALNKVFVAGKYGDRLLLRERMKALHNLGYVITHDWTYIDADTNTDTNTDKKISKQDIAMMDVNGVKTCDILIVILDDKNYPYRGTMTELGIAIGLNKKIFVVISNEAKETMMTNIYLHYKNNLHIFNNWNELLEIMKNQCVVRINSKL
jgi:hypothetical protein